MPNGRAPRRHEFFFSPRDYLNDPAVLAMDLPTRGAYSTLLFGLWDQPEPGVAPASDAVLSALARASVSEWTQVRDRVAEAFDTTSRPGWWVQKRMVYERQRQDMAYDKARKLGSVGGHKSAELRALARGPQGGLKSASTASPDSSVSSDSSDSPADSKSTHLPIFDGRPDKLEIVKADPRAEWDEGFHEGFWPDYPRKVKKSDALKAWRSVKPWTQSNLDAICAGMWKWIDYWKSKGTEMDKIPYPATFLRSAQHEGEPQ